MNIQRPGFTTYFFDILRKLLRASFNSGKSGKYFLYFHRALDLPIHIISLIFSMCKNKIIMFILGEEVAAYCMKDFKKLFPSCGNRGRIYIKLKLTRTVNYFFG